MNMRYLYQHKENQGFVVLLSAMIVMVVGITIAVGLLVLSVGATKSSFALEQSFQAKGLANACAEIALNGLRLDEHYVWPGQQTIGQGTCDATIGGSGDSDRTIEASGVVGTITRKVDVDVSSLSPTISLNQWEEVSDF